MGVNRQRISSAVNDMVETMNEVDRYIKEINRMITELDREEDRYFIRQIYTILYRHEEKEKEKALFTAG